MREYAVMIFAVAAVICVSGFVAYKGARDVSVRFALGVILIYTVLSPITEWLSGESGEPAFELEFDEGDFSADYIEVTKDAFCLGIERAVCEEYGLNGEGVAVSVVGFDFGNMRAEKIRVILSGAAALADRKSIERYVDAMGRGVCEVGIEIG